MHPFVLLLLAIFTPFVLLAVLLVPVYAGLFGAAYIIYMPASGAHPLAERLTDLFYIVDVYTHLFTYWTQHSGGVSFVNYTLPVIGLPLAGGLIALYATYKLVRKLVNVFHLSASI